MAVDVGIDLASTKGSERESAIVLPNRLDRERVITINYGGMGQLSKLPGYQPVTECHRGNVILDLNSN